jgi:NitT/TauT family transport system ATP-binding protein
MSMIFRDISKTYSNHRVLDRFNLEIPRNTITCLLGASGIGKTTLINILAGIIQPDRGKILSPFAAGEISYLFQESLLLPWMTVQQNISYLMGGNLSREEKRTEADKLTRMMELDGFSSHYPAELSGGMIRRTALARALAMPAPLLIMDEPFVSLDTDLKDRIIDIVQENIENKQRTAVIVTHDIQMARQIGARIFIAQKGVDGCLRVKPEEESDSDTRGHSILKLSR